MRVHLLVITLTATLPRDRGLQKFTLPFYELLLEYVKLTYHCRPRELYGAEALPAPIQLDYTMVGSIYYDTQDTALLTMKRVLDA